MQIADIVIAVSTVMEALMEGATSEGRPNEPQLYRALSSGLRTLAERFEGERAATIGELQARVVDLERRLGAAERQIENGERGRETSYAIAEQGRDARAAATEEDRERRFAACLATVSEQTPSPASDPAPGRSPGPRLLDVIAGLIADEQKPASIRRWLSAHGWARKSQRSAPLRTAAVELRACDQGALAEVVAVVTSDMVWPDLIDTLAALQGDREDAPGEILDLAGARRAARRRS